MRLATVLRAGAATVVAAGVAFAGLGPASSAASSHREAPLVAADPAVDNTDLYAFVSPERAGYVTFIANWQPFEEPNGGPNFYPFATDAVYNINVDSDGDAKADAVFRWTFQNVDKRGGNTFLYANGPVTSLDDENLLFRQTYTLESSFHGEPFKTRISNAPVAPSRVGQATMPDYAKLRADANKRLPGGWNVYAGQADDPFFLDLRVFDLLYGGDLSEVGQDTLAGYNVNTIALQVPFSDVALKGDAKRNPVIGVWSTTERGKTRVTGQTTAVGGDRVQVSRLGNPLVNEVVVPASLKDAFNSISPDKDAGIPAVVARVTDPELPKLIEAIYKVAAPPAPRNDLVEIFLTGITTKANGPIKADLNSQLNNADVVAANFRPSEMLRLNLGVPVAAQPNRLGVLAGDLQGFPNGRRLTDDVVDIAVQAVEGAAQTGKLVDALATGDKVDANDNAFSFEFPYLALPNTASVNKGGGTGAGSTGGTGGGSVPSASAAAANPDTTPSAFESGMGMTAVTVGTSALAAGLGAALFVGWWRRRGSPLSSSVHSRGGSTAGPPRPTDPEGEIPVRLRMIFTVVLAAALLFGLGAVVGRTGGTQSAAWKNADDTRPTGRLTTRIAGYQERLRKVPGDWTTWAALGEAYLEQARTGADPAYYPKAEGALRQSLQVRPDGNADALTGLGALANARHDFAGALAYARQALAVNAYSDTAFGVLADAHTQLGHPAEAGDAVQRMLDLRPGLGSYTRASYDLEQHGRRIEAIALMRKALEAATEPADIAFCHQHLGALAWAAGDLVTATREVSLGLAADGTLAGLWQLKSKVDAAAGDLDTALADLDKVVRRTPTVDVLLDQARLLGAAGRDPAPALRLAEAAHQLFTANGGTDDLAASALALAAGNAGQAAELAVREWDRRQFSEVGDAVAWSLLAAGRPADALPFVQHAEALGQIDATVAYHHGMIALAAGDRATARTQLQLALALNPHFSPVDAPAAVRALATLEP